MQWKGRRQSSNIEDRRSEGGGLGGLGGGLGGGMGRGPIRIPIRAGGGSFSGLVILVVLFFALRACGIDPLELLDGGQSPQQTQTQSRSQSGTGTGASDQMTQFVATVLAETEDTWQGIFKSEGATYRDPKLVLFSNSVNSACGFASAATGPFYCPGDEKVYLDTSFFNQLARELHAGGEFAQAYVIAHEVGHHVQNLIGVLPKFNQMRRSMSEADANKMSVQVELQADCFAGVWAHFTEQKGLLDVGDIDDALNAAAQIGDDTLQKRAQGYVVPESFNHGTSAQRQKWFKSGYASGRLSDCDTFNNPV